MILADFGGFLTEPKSADVHAITHNFSPPYTDVSFNASLTKDDGLLKSEISHGQHVSLEAASELIKEFVEDLKHQLKIHQTHELTGLGRFELKDGKLIYHSDNLENLNSEGYGLPSFKFEPIVRETEDMKRVRPVPPARRVIRRQPEVKKIIKSELKDQDEKLGTLATHPHEDHTTKEEKIINNKKSAYLLIPLLILLFAGGVAGYLFYNKNSQKAQLASSNTETAVKQDQASLVSGTALTDTQGTSTPGISNGIDAVSDDLGSTPSAAVSSEVKNTQESLAAPKAVTQAVTTSTSDNSSFSSNSTQASTPSYSDPQGLTRTGDFHIIGNVFGVESNANKYSTKNPGSKVVKIGRLYHVILSTYGTLDEASNALPTMRTEHGNAVWIKKY